MPRERTCGPFYGRVVAHRAAPANSHVDAEAWERYITTQLLANGGELYDALSEFGVLEKVASSPAGCCQAYNSRKWPAR